MIKVNKDLNDLPASLKFTGGNCLTTKSKTTYKRWEEIIEKERYPKSKKDDSTFINKCNTRYKQDDIKKKLSKIYNDKCAFCEQRVEIFAVEHFRPKDIYYWLCYSWDNLLYACTGCNSPKSNHFDVVPVSNKATFDKTNISKVLNNIHGLAEIYKVSENPQLIHPEQEDAEPLLVFDTKGSVCSDDKRMQYTIDTCKLNREKLNEYRKEIYDDIEKKVQDLLLSYKVSGNKKYLHQLRFLQQDFKKSCQKKEDVRNKKEFLAFRRFVVKVMWV